MAGPRVIIGFDGTPTSEHAVRAAGALLAPRRALVAVVWEPTLAYDLVANPLTELNAPATKVDVRSAIDLDHSIYEAAMRLAMHGASLARECGLDADGLVVADERTVAETIVRLAGETNAGAVVVGTRSHNRLSELLLGSTSGDVVRHARCPVIVIPESDRSD